MSEAPGVLVPQIWTDTLLPIVQSQIRNASLFNWRVEPQDRERYRRKALRRQKIEARKRVKE